MMKRSRVIGACTWMALGHRDARLTLVKGHLMLKLALGPHLPLSCLLHCSLALPTMVAVYLYSHLAD